MKAKTRTKTKTNANTTTENKLRSRRRFIDTDFEDYPLPGWDLVGSRSEWYTPTDKYALCPKKYYKVLLMRSMLYDLQAIGKLNGLYERVFNVDPRCFTIPILAPLEAIAFRLDSSYVELYEAFDRYDLGVKPFKWSSDLRHYYQWLVCDDSIEDRIVALNPSAVSVASFSYHRKELMACWEIVGMINESQL